MHIRPAEQFPLDKHQQNEADYVLRKDVTRKVFSMAGIVSSSIVSKSEASREMVGRRVVATEDCRPGQTEAVARRFSFFLPGQPSSSRPDCSGQQSKLAGPNEAVPPAMRPAPRFFTARRPLPQKL